MLLRFLTGKAQDMYKLSNQKKFSNGSFIYTKDTQRLYIYMNDNLVALTPSQEEIRKRKETFNKCKYCGAPLKFPEIGYSSLIKCDYCLSFWEID